MKKLFLTICLVAMLSTPAIAACDGGTLSDDGQFCISNIRLNWWSAANWCKANGMHLATMYEVCPDWDGSTNDNCKIASSIGDYAWTATVSGSDRAYKVIPSRGMIYTEGRDYSMPFAMCK